MPSLHSITHRHSSRLKAKPHLSWEVESDLLYSRALTTAFLMLSRNKKTKLKKNACHSAGPWHFRVGGLDVVLNHLPWTGLQALSLALTDQEIEEVLEALLSSLKTHALKND